MGRRSATCWAGALELEDRVDDRAGGAAVGRPGDVELLAAQQVRERPGEREIVLRVRHWEVESGHHRHLTARHGQKLCDLRQDVSERPVRGRRWDVVSLTLVTGPANAAKAGVVLGGFREALARSGSLRLPAPEPLLVVPTAADVEPYQRELAASSAVFGGEVVTFSRLLGLIARRAGYRQRRLGLRRARPRGRVRGGRGAAARAGGERRARPASRAPPAGCSPSCSARWWRRSASRPACGAWVAAEGGGRAAYAEDVAGLYAAYVRRLEALGRVDPEGYAWGALDALRADPSSWGGRPVFLYGFDDLTPTQLDAVETLVRVCDADVTLSLTYEPGRAAFAARAATVETLRPLAATVDRAAGRRRAVARPRCTTSSATCSTAARDRVAPNGAVRLLEAGGERAEAELIGAALLELVEAGAAPADIAVLVRTAEQAPLLAQTLEAYGLPVERAERVRGPRHAARRRAARLRRAPRWAAPRTTCCAGCARRARSPRPRRSTRSSAACAGRRTTAADAVALTASRRTASAPAAATASGTRTGATARWRRRSDRRGCARRLSTTPRGRRGGAAAFLDALEAELEAIWTAPHRRAAAVLDADGLRRRARRRRGALRRAASCASWPTPTRRSRAAPPMCCATLGAVEVRLGAAAAPGVLLADPLAVRARRFRAVVVCGLPGRRLPAPADARAVPRRRRPARPGARVRDRPAAARGRARPRALPLLLRGLARGGGPVPVLPRLGRGGRAAAALAVRRRRRRPVHGGPVGGPRPPAARRGDLAARAGADAAGAAPRAGGRPPRTGPRPPRWRRPDARRCSPATTARARAGWRRSPAAACAGWSSACSSRRRIDPDPEPMRRGSLAHAVLERTLRRRSRSATGSAALTPASRADAARRARRRDRRPAPHARRRDRPARACARSRSSCGRWLDHECETGPGYEPQWLEWSFGGGRAAAPERRRGHRPRRPHRRRARPARSCATTRPARASRRPTWAADGHLQAALYALAARELLGLDLAGALYQPLRGNDLRPRGAVRTGDAAAGLVANDVVDPGAWERAARRAARGGRGRRGPPARRRDRPLPGALHPARLRLPRHLPRPRRRPATAVAVMSRAFTPEQRAAIDDRAGSSLLAANAGSGKTAVMVERFVEAVLARRRRGRRDPRAHVHREGGGRAARAHPPPLHRARRARARAHRRGRGDRHHPRLLRRRAARAPVRRRAGPALRRARRGRAPGACTTPPTTARWRRGPAPRATPAVDLLAAAARRPAPDGLRRLRRAAQPRRAGAAAAGPAGRAAARPGAAAAPRWRRRRVPGGGDERQERGRGLEALEAATPC